MIMKINEINKMRNKRNKRIKNNLFFIKENTPKLFVILIN